MMGMGMQLTPEQQAHVREMSEKRKAEVRKYREENGFAQPEEADHEHGEGCGCGHDHVHEPEPDFSFEESDVDEEAVMAYIRSRQDVLDQARRKLKSQHAEIQHLKNQLKVSESKVSALQVALGKMRDQLKAAKAAAAPAEAAPEAPATAE